MENEAMKEIDAQKILDEIQDNHNLDRLAEMIKDNKIEFQYKEQKYRVRQLNFGEKEELDQLRRRKFGELLKDKDILLEKDLISLYKERGINIDEIDEQIRKLETERISIQMKLGEALSKKIEENIVKTYKEQIVEINNRVYILTIQRNGLLSYSLENQLKDYAVKLLAYFSIEIKNEEKWDRLFKTMEEFNNYNDDKFIEQVIYNTLLIH